MKITTNVFGPETRLKKEVSLDSESSTLREVLTILASQDDTALKRILRADLSPEEGYVILVNGRNVSSLNRLETRIEDGDEITFTVLMAGGRFQGSLLHCVSNRSWLAERLFDAALSLHNYLS